MGNFVPWRLSAWALLRERIVFLAEKRTSDPTVVRTAGANAAALADKLAAHIPVRDDEPERDRRGPPLTRPSTDP